MVPTAAVVSGRTYLEGARPASRVESGIRTRVFVSQWKFPHMISEKSGSSSVVENCGSQSICRHYSPSQPCTP